VRHYTCLSMKSRHSPCMCHIKHGKHTHTHTQTHAQTHIRYVLSIRPFPNGYFTDVFASTFHRNADHRYNNTGKANAAMAWCYAIIYRKMHISIDLRTALRTIAAKIWFNKCRCLVGHDSSDVIGLWSFLTSTEYETRCVYVHGKIKKLEIGCGISLFL